MANTGYKNPLSNTESSELTLPEAWIAEVTVLVRAPMSRPRSTWQQISSGVAMRSGRGSPANRTPHTAKPIIMIASASASPMHSSARHFPAISSAARSRDA